MFERPHMPKLRIKYCRKKDGGVGKGMAHIPGGMKRDGERFHQEWYAI